MNKFGLYIYCIYYCTMKTKQRKLIDIPLEDITTLAAHGLTTRNIKFKAYAEKILADHAKKIRNLTKIK